MVVLSREDIIKLYLNNKDIFKSSASTKTYNPNIIGSVIKNMHSKDTNMAYNTQKHHKHGNLFHRLDGPAVENSNIEIDDEYWIYGVHITTEELFKTVRTFFEENKGLEIKIFSIDEYQKFLKEKNDYTGIIVIPQTHSFFKFIDGNVSSNKGYATISLSSAFANMNYCLNGVIFNSKKEWEIKRKQVFESDYDELISKFKTQKEVYRNFNLSWYNTYRGNNTIFVQDYQDYKIYDFDLTGKLLSQTYYEDYTFSKKISYLDHINLRKQTEALASALFDKEIKIIKKHGYEQIDPPEYFCGGDCLTRLKQKETGEILQCLFDTKTKDFRLKIGNEEFRSTPNLKMDLESFLKKEVALTTKIFSYKDEFNITKTQTASNKFLYYFSFPKQNMSHVHFGDLKKNLSHTFEFKCLVKDHNLNEEEFLNEIGELIPELNISHEELYNTVRKEIDNPPPQQQIFPDVSTKAKEIAKRVAVKRIANIVAALVVQHVFGNLKKTEHQKIKDFFKTDIGISIVKLLTAQLLPLLKPQLPEKYQGVYQSIVEEFDIQSKVDLTDGFIDLVIENINTDSFVSFQFLDNQKTESTGVRANPLVLESPISETLGVSIEATQEKEKLLLKKE